VPTINTTKIDQAPQNSCSRPVLERHRYENMTEICYLMGQHLDRKNRACLTLVEGLDDILADCSRADAAESNLYTFALFVHHTHARVHTHAYTHTHTHTHVHAHSRACAYRNDVKVNTYRGEGRRRAQESPSEVIEIAYLIHRRGMQPEL